MNSNYCNPYKPENISNCPIRDTSFCQCSKNCKPKRCKREYVPCPEGDEEANECSVQSLEAKNHNNIGISFSQQDLVERFQKMDLRLQQIERENTELRNIIFLYQNELVNSSARLHNIEETLRQISTVKEIESKYCPLNTSQFLPFPNEVICAILENLDFKEKMNLRVVSHYARKIIDESITECDIFDGKYSSILCNFTNLRKLTIHRLIHCVDIKCLNQFKHLSDLQLCDIQFLSEESIHYLTQLPLKKLKIQGVRDFKYCFLSRMPGLEELKISRQCGNVLLAPFIKLPNLKKLVLYDCYELQSCLTAFYSFKQLEYLHIECYRFEVPSLAFLKNCSKLKYLTMSTCLNRFGDLEISTLTEFRELEHLNIMGYNVTDLESLKDLTSLKFLSIGVNCQDSSTKAKLLDNLQNLEYLNLTCPNAFDDVFDMC